ncbi:MAG: hypothetical protein EXR74_02370 [Bdellovibrionales bacterium]|nr:hypothetical protein [Bdellovibrionales bacterium]
MNGEVKKMAKLWAYAPVGIILLFYCASSFPITPAKQLYEDITKTVLGESREPSMGAIRGNKDETDIRTLFQSTDGRELIVKVWSPRVHPFKKAPAYTIERECLPGEYFESTVGIRDLNRSLILQKLEIGGKISHVFQWNSKTKELIPGTAPLEAPQQWTSIGRIVDNKFSGGCVYEPSSLNPNEDSETYLLKQIEIAKNTNVTDIIFPKTVFDFISGQPVNIQGDYSVTLSQLKDISLDFNNSAFLLRPNTGGLKFTNSQRVAIKNLTLDWAKPKSLAPDQYTGMVVHGIFAVSEGNSDLWFDNINFRRVPGWAFYFDTLRGGLISNCNIGSYPSDHIESARKGGVKAFNTQDLIIRQNSFSHLGDDAISLHGQFAVVNSDVFPLKTTKPQEEPLSCVGLGSSLGPIIQNDNLGFFSETMGYQGALKVRSTEKFSPLDEKIPDYCKGFANCSRVCFVPITKFTPIKGGVATSLTQLPSLFIIHGNNISKIKGRGIVVQGSNGILSENIVSDTEGAGIQLTADLGNQSSGPGAFNILLKNNRLQSVATNAEYLRDIDSGFGGISLVASRKDRDGRSILISAPLIQHIRIEGAQSSIENAGSVALQISSAENIEVKSLLIGNSGLIRNLSSGSLSGSQAEGSVLLTRCQDIDLSGLSSPALMKSDEARNRTLVIDAQYVNKITIPLTTKGLPNETANTIWFTTFRNWFKEDPTKPKRDLIFSINAPSLSLFKSRPPIEVFHVIGGKIGDKEKVNLGAAIPITISSSLWTSKTPMSWQSPDRVQLRPTLKNNYPNLFLFIESIQLQPEKISPFPQEG